MKNLFNGFGMLVMCVTIVLCAQADDIGMPQSKAPALIFPGAQWQEASPASQGITEAMLDSALLYFHEHSAGMGTDEMVIIRNGYLIWKGAKADTVHEISSCTKTFTSTVLGLLVTEGRLNVDDYAVQYHPKLDDQYPEYAQIKLSQLASMTSGYTNIKGGGYEYNVKSDRAKHHERVLTYTIPGSPMFPAGTAIDYHDPQVHMLGYILTKVAGESLEDIFRKRIAVRIGMQHFGWSNYGERDGMFFNNPAGTPGNNQRGVRSSALDLARYGLLYLAEGSWNGERLLDASFVQRAVSNQAPADIKSRPSYLAGSYGFYWWTNGVRADGTRPWPSAPPRAYTARGASRNFIFVIPEWNLVIVRLSPGDAASAGGMEEHVWENFFSRLRNAFEQ